MIRHRHVIRSLPLLADVLGKKYGIRVEIGGGVAKTNGTVIYLPSLPVDADDTLLPMIRGFIDHEAAHIRETSFTALKGVSPLEGRIANTIEDWRVERELAAVYPGCAQNFQWLIKHLFLGKAEDNAARAAHPAMHILDWLLITVRSWDVRELAQEREFLRSLVEKFFPGLAQALDAVLLSIPGACNSTKDAAKFARRLASIIKKHLGDLEDSQGSAAETQGEDAENQNTETQNSTGSPSGRESRENADAALCGADSQLPTHADSSPAVPEEAATRIASLKDLLASPSQALPDDLDSILQEAVADACAQADGRITVAREDRKTAYPLSPHDIAAVKQATTALRTRLQAFLQSMRSVRNHNGYAGRLDMRRLHALFMGKAEVFLKKGVCAGIHTAVHILLDASHSMYRDGRMTLACHACYAVASVLHAVRGINVGVTVFPGDRDSETVTPILRHRQGMHDAFMVAANGNTPMDAALWWVWRQMYPMAEARKIVLVITDGLPNHYAETEIAVKALLDFGLEVYTVGIMENSVLPLFPKGNSSVIHDIRELAPAVFQMLQTALIGRKSAA